MQQLQLLFMQQAWQTAAAVTTTTTHTHNITITTTITTKALHPTFLLNTKQHIKQHTKQLYNSKLNSS